MAYVAAEARRELLDEIADAIGEIATSLAALGAAYELLDEATGDALEEQLFGPVQLAYGRARRAHAGFAERFGLPGRAFAPAPSPAPSRGVAGLVEDAVAAAAEADFRLAELQDSMLPVEVGDPELRAGLAEVRRLLADVSGNAARFTRTLGR